LSNNTKKPSYPGNSVMVRPDGPLICKSDSTITLQNVSEDIVLKDNEFALCRCGLSKQKPFCDGSHKKEAITLEQNFVDKRSEDIKNLTGDLIITVKNNAMYSIAGPVTIFSRDGKSKTTRTKAALCRCGHSENKPFCDMKHKTCGFSA